MPLWDALNHITGRCNVRLHHDEDAECLQMIATGQHHCFPQLILMLPMLDLLMLHVFLCLFSN